MNILYVYDGDWPKGATRVAKETRSLATRHEVTLVCRNESRDEQVQQEPWMTVRRLPAFGPRLLNRALNFPYFFNPMWIWHLFRTAHHIEADCVVVADLPLAPTALAVGRALQLPVYYDMAEVYPEFIRSRWETGEMRWTDHIVRNPWVADVLERFVVTKMEKLFTVSEESLQRLIAMGVDPARIVLVGNSPEDPEAYLGRGSTPEDMRPYEGRAVLLFVGILIGDRGVATAVRAMEYLKESHPEAVLVVVGDGPDRPRLEAECRSRGLEASVAFLGWKPHELLPDYYACGAIGLLPFDDGRHIRLTLANKLFDYMAAGLPVIASDLRPMRRVVEQCESGLMVEPESPEALAQAAVRMLDDPALRRSMGEMGRRAVAERYNWQHDQRRLLDAFERRGAAGHPHD